MKLSDTQLVVLNAACQRDDRMVLPLPKTLKGELVDRARATALVFRLAREERDAWVNWPARVAALMAAELGLEAHPMQKTLETHVRAHLAELAETRPEFR